MFCVLWRAQLALSPVPGQPDGVFSSAEEAGGACPGGMRSIYPIRRVLPLLHGSGLNPPGIIDSAGKGSCKAHLVKCLDLELRNANKVHWALLQSQAYSSETSKCN